MTDTDRLIHTSRRRRFVGAAVFAVGLALAGCSSSEPSPSSYFQALETATRQYAESLEDLRATYGEELSSELSTLMERTDFSDTSEVASFFDQGKEAAIVKTADLFSREASELRVFMDALRQLEPPEGLVSAHGDLAAGGDGLAAAMPVTIEAVRNLDAIDDLPVALQSTPYTVASQRFGIACENLASSAAAQGIEVELSCPGVPDDLTDDAG